MARATCSTCGSDEPFHVHDGENVIEDYFTIGRGLSDFQAAQAWKQKYVQLRREVADLHEPETRESGLTLCKVCRAPTRPKPPADAEQSQEPSTAAREGIA